MWLKTQERERVTFEGASFSRVKAGPTSFGMAGRSVLTFLVLDGMVIGYPMARGGLLAEVGFDVPGTPFLIGYTAVAVAFTVFLLIRIWRRGRIA